MPQFPNEAALAALNIPPPRPPRAFRELVEDAPSCLFNFGDLRTLGGRYEGPRPYAVTLLYRANTRFNKTVTQHPDGSWKTTRAADPASYKFRLCEVELRSVRHWAQLLEALERQPSLVVIRGRRVDSGRSFLLDDHRRAKFVYPIPESEKDKPPGDFADEERIWMFLDIDGVAIPQRFDLDDFEAIAEWVISEHLPPPFRGVSAAWQFSSTHGLGGKHEAKLHLVMALDTPVSGRDLDKFLQARRRIFDLDPSVNRAVQPFYCARAEYVRFDGSEAPDPFGGKSRVGLFYGEADVVELTPHLEEWRLEARFDELVARVASSGSRRSLGANGSSARGCSPAAYSEKCFGFFVSSTTSGGYYDPIFSCLMSAAGRGMSLEEAAPIIVEVANAVAAERGASADYIRDTLNGKYLTPTALRPRYEDALRKVNEGRVQNNKMDSTTAGPETSVERAQ